MTLLDVISQLNQFDDEDTIYAKAPWTVNSTAVVAREPEEGGIPERAKYLDSKYLLEISIAREFLQDWLTRVSFAPTNLQKCEKIIQYAINDA